MSEPTKLFVGSLKWELTEDELREAFAVFGPVKSVKIVKDRETGKSRGFGFVEFEDSAACKTAREEMQDFELRGRKLVVDYASNQDSRPRTPRTDPKPEVDTGKPTRKVRRTRQQSA